MGEPAWPGVQNHVRYIIGLSNNEHRQHKPHDFNLDSKRAGDENDMNTYESTFIMRPVLIFLELSSVKTVVSLTCLNLKVDEAVIFDRASPTKADKSTYNTYHLLSLCWISKALISIHLAAVKCATVGLLN